MEMKSHITCMINRGVKVAALVNIFIVLVETWTRMCMEMILTSWSRPIGIILLSLLWILCLDHIFPEKLTVSVLIIFSPTFYGSCNFITIFTAACDWFLLWVESTSCTETCSFNIQFYNILFMLSYFQVFKSRFFSDSSFPPSLLIWSLW